MLRLVPVLVLLTGCLGSNYRVSAGELDRIAQAPRSERGAVLRATQELSIGAGNISDNNPGATQHVSILVARAAAQETANAIVRRAPRLRGARRSDVPPVELRSPAPRAEPLGGRGVGGSAPRRSGGSSGGGGGVRDGRAALVIVAIAAVAVSAGVLALALSEGARYDG